MTRWTETDLKGLRAKRMAEAKPRKYRNTKVTVDGITFDSKKEAARYHELRLLEKAGQVNDIICQPDFPIRVNGVLVAHYFADFQWRRHNGDVVFEDVKSPATRTPLYRLKKKLVEAIYCIKIQEL